MSDDNKYIGRWYNEKQNTDYYPGLSKSVADNTNIHLRRHNNRIGNAYQDISSKLEIIGYHVKSIQNRLELGKQLLPEMLLDLEKDISKDPTIRRRAALENNIYIEFYDYVLASHIEGALIQSKALLDSTAQIYSIAFDRDIRTFSKYGKNMLNDINGLKIEFNSFKNELAKIIVEHKETWIDETIKNRDLVVHYGQLRDFKCPMLQLSNHVKYTIEDVSTATIPGGKSVFEFSEDLLDSIHIFSKAVMKVLFTKFTNDARSSVLSTSRMPQSRNSLCPCWSGDKYKYCHGKLA